MSNENTSPEQVRHNLAIKPGFIKGTAVVRDKDGNIKGELTFGGEATAEQIEAMKQAFPDKEVT